MNIFTCLTAACLWFAAAHAATEPIGDAGNALLDVFSSRLSYRASQVRSLTLAHNLYSRRTHYRDRPNVEYATSDALLTAGYTF